jgi:precorrin-8X/cobalt-precorrin-8 methylmutase
MFSNGSMTVELLGPLFEGGGAAEQVTDRSRRRVSSMRSYRAVPAARIQPMSFDMISRSMDLLSFPADSGRRQVIVRAVHATADFSLADRFHFTPGAVQRGRAALENPSVPVVTDVNMVAAGIGRLFSGRVVCRVADPEAARLARESGLTRSAAAMELVKDRLHGALVAIGNAPTALVHLLQIITRDGIQPGLIVGVPVGLVGAAEAKEMLVDSGVPCITVLGNRGGSTVASAVVNALGTLPLPGDHDAGTSKAGSPDGGTPDAGTTGTGSPA